MPSPRPRILVLTPTLKPFAGLFEDSFELFFATDDQARDAAISREGASFSGMVTTGKLGLSRAEIARLTALQVVCVLGAGTENIDLEAAREAGVRIEARGGTNSETVADHAFALLLSLLRDIPFMDRGIRHGEWAGVRSSRPILHRKRLGIAGLGAIGRAVARRAVAFDMQVGYFGRTAKPDTNYRFHADCGDLAACSDVLVLCLPGGPETTGLVDARVLRALGPQGYIVNVGRGSVVHQAALVEALENGGIAGAALDVFENEPNVPAPLRANRNVVLTPHVAGRSPESDAAMSGGVLQSLTDHFRSTAG